VKMIRLKPPVDAHERCHGGLEFVDLRSGVNVRI